MTPFSKFGRVYNIDVRAKKSEAATTMPGALSEEKISSPEKGQLIRLLDICLLETENIILTDSNFLVTQVDKMSKFCIII